MDGFEVTRRQVLVGSAGVGFLGACAACGLGGCASAEKKAAVVTTGVVNIGRAEQYPAGTVNESLMERYGIVVTNDSGTALALRPKCTHKGCMVKWAEAELQFECPCHGSRFDLLGQVTRGPAKKALAGVAAVRQGDGTLTVDLDKVYGG